MGRQRGRQAKSKDRGPEDKRGSKLGLRKRRQGKWERKERTRNPGPLEIQFAQLLNEGKDFYLAGLLIKYNGYIKCLALRPTDNRSSIMLAAILIGEKKKTVFPKGRHQKMWYLNIVYLYKCTEATFN